MEYTITADRPVYIQLVEQLELALITGEYPPGGRIPPVRELAAQAGVNPNTMQRALQELENRGLLQAQRTAGRTVTADTEMLTRLCRTRAELVAGESWQRLHALGLDADEAVALLRSAAERHTPTESGQPVAPQSESPQAAEHPEQEDIHDGSNL